jgi:ubiquinone/menaquinone biosynthesis C-methylase UbiE
MNLYKTHILPNLIISGCDKKSQMKQREKIVPLAKGKVLEIGVGSGLNLPFYKEAKIKELIGLDPSRILWDKRVVKEKELGFNFEFVEAIAEDMPFEKHTFDTVVITYTLCTIFNFKVALESIHKALKPSGKLLFCEHGKAPDRKVYRAQNFLNPLWKNLAGGCNINRDIPKIISTNGFQIQDLQTMYVPGWKPASFNFWGKAKPL